MELHASFDQQFDEWKVVVMGSAKEGIKSIIFLAYVCCFCVK
jgi:hypothetical protein